MSADEKLTRWFEKNLSEHISRIIIDGLDGDGLLAFGAYQIKPTDGKFRVWYYSDLQSDFSSCRVALSYCVADHNEQLRLARDIQVLDSKKQQLDADVMFAKEQARCTKNTNAREIILTKIQTKEATRRLVTAELEKCIKSAKYLQLRGFSNETARLSRNKSQ